MNVCANCRCRFQPRYSHAPGTYCSPVCMAESRRVIWTDDMVAALRRLRERGTPIKACVDEIGVSHGLVSKKCRELGLNERRAAA